MVVGVQDQKILESERFRLCRLDLERDTGRGSLILGGGVVMASTGMATVETPPYINNAVSTWNALQVQLARGSLITQMMNDN
ncbi:uncharacterized protein N7511_010394 [Penicillium nucicola]|uniref:uncharacterized protein n=1 Tax=Penicillium nucicola TaxID=1850975 RepID=UPI002545416B|nr:uncharacterized protein N7511_010394 [Penicillium nucicola]KAJ5748698.1 hypothetical protein N7511_010394 [Penicillium nucicola]